MEKEIGASIVNEKTSTNSFKFLKSSTGIKGFDEITLGGLPLNRPKLLVGAYWLWQNIYVNGVSY